VRSGRKDEDMEFTGGPGLVYKSAANVLRFFNSLRLDP